MVRALVGRIETHFADGDAKGRDLEAAHVQDVLRANDYPERFVERVVRKPACVVHLRLPVLHLHHNLNPVNISEAHLNYVASVCIVRRSHDVSQQLFRRFDLRRRTVTFSGSM